MKKTIVAIFMFFVLINVSFGINIIAGVNTNLDFTCYNASNAAPVGTSATITCRDKNRNADISAATMTNVATGVFNYTFTLTEDTYSCSIDCATTTALDPRFFIFADSRRIGLVINAVNTTSIASGGISADEIATDAIGSAEIATDAITSAEIADNSIDAGAFATDAITAAKIAADAIGASELATDAIGSLEIASGAITVNELNNSAINASKIKANTITFEKINNSAITANVLADAAIGVSEWAAEADNNGINWADVTNQGTSVTLSSTTVSVATTASTCTAVTTVNGLAANVITAGSIATDAFTSDEFAATGTAEIADAVFDEPVNTHDTENSFGDIVQYTNDTIQSILVDTAAQDTANEMEFLMSSTLDNLTQTHSAGNWSAIGGSSALTAASIWQYVNRNLTIPVNVNDTVVTIIEGIKSDTDAYDTDAEYATAIWNANTGSYGGASTYAQAVEDILVDTTAYDTDGEYATAIWGALSNSYETAGTFGLLQRQVNDTVQQKLDLAISAVEQAVAGNATSVTVTSIGANVITASSIAADAVGSSELATTAVDEIVDGTFDELVNTHDTENSFGDVIQTMNNSVKATEGYVDTEVAAILVDTSAYDTDGEYATAIWNAATATYGGAGTYGQAVEDVLADTTAYDTDGEYATAIWSALSNSYEGAGTFGLLLRQVNDTLQTNLNKKISSVEVAIVNNQSLPVSLEINSVNTSTLKDGTITVNKLNNSAINASKIKANTITSEKINNSAITSGVIADSAIQASEIHSTADAEIADAVWDEILNTHIITQSAGAVLRNINNTVQTINTNMCTDADVTTITNNQDTIYLEILALNESTYNYFISGSNENQFKADVSLLALETTAQSILTDSNAQDTASEWNSLMSSVFTAIRQNATISQNLNDTVVTLIEDIKADTDAQDTANEWEGLMSSSLGNITSSHGAGLYNYTSGQVVLSNSDLRTIATAVVNTTVNSTYPGNNQGLGETVYIISRTR